LFYAIALRYVKNPTEAEDLMVESFYKIFTKIGASSSVTFIV